MSNLVFVSYSHQDKEWLDRLREVLTPEVRNGRIVYWDDRELQPGDEWYTQIVASIDSARVAVLLVSPSFFASNFVLQEEIPRIVRASAERGLTILWIPLWGVFSGPNAMQGAEILDARQAVCDPAQPLEAMDSASCTAVLLGMNKRLNKLLHPERIPANLPYPSLGDLFKGRDPDLARLDSQLRQGNSAAIVQPQILSGMGGLGKTRLAVEYAWRRRNDFTALLFVFANTPDDLDINFARLSASDILDLPEYTLGKQDDQHAAVTRWLQQNRGWLLILDNVDTPEAAVAVNQLIARLGSGYILITSRLNQRSGSVRRFTLDVLPLADAVALLLDLEQDQRAVRPDDLQQAEALAKRLGCLPLALTHAAAYLANYGEGFADYLGRVDRDLAALLEFHDAGVMDYPREVAATFFTSFDRLGSLEKSILRAASYLAPEPIPAVMFESCPDELRALTDLWRDETGEQCIELSLRDALANLARFSLVTRVDGTFSVHRVEQLVLQSRVPKERVPDWVEHTRAVLCKFAPDQNAEDPRTWPIWDRIRPHAEALVEWSVADSRIQPHIELMAALAALYFGKGLYYLSLNLEEKALEVAERLRGNRSALVADRLLGYGESLRVLKRVEEAEKAFARSVSIYDELEGPNSPSVGAALSYLALAQNALGKRDDAESTYRRAIKICKDHGDETVKSDLVKALYNLALLLREQGKDAESVDLLSQSVDLIEADFDNQIKPQLAIVCLTQLALCDYETHRAENLLRRALERASVLPTNHFVYEYVIESFASFLRDTHQLAEARRQFASLATTERARWGMDGSEKLSERRLRPKLRICEACIDVTWDLLPNSRQESEAQAELLAETNGSDWEPWYPPMIRSITVVDAQNLRFTFSIDSGTDVSRISQQQTRLLMDYFLSAIAVNEDDQWASASGKMPLELRGTSLGFELVEQAKNLARLIEVAMGPGTITGSEFGRHLEELSGQPRAKWLPVTLEVWITPSKQSVYAGEQTELSPFTAAPGEARAFILEALMEVHWECRPDAKHPYSESRWKTFLGCFEVAFRSSVLPVIQRSLVEGKFLAPLRQILYVMTLATWFKGDYKLHPRIAKYLESGNTSQLAPINYELDAQEDSADAASIVDADLRAERAVTLNQSALDLRKVGRPAEAEELLREALAIEQATLLPGNPKKPHRLNNLASVLLMQGKIEEGQQVLAQAWSLKQGDRDQTSARILVTRALASVLAEQSLAHFLGQLKATLDGTPLPARLDIAVTWDFSPVLDYLRDHLPDREREFLRTLADTLNHPTETSVLDSFLAWRDQLPIPLETSWPAEHDHRRGGG